MRGTPGNNQVDRLSYLVGLLGASGTSGGRQNWTNTAFFVDPSNVTGTASDANTGLTAGQAILTTAELNRRLFLKNVVVHATITYLSDDLSGTVLDLSGVSVAATGTLTFQGTPQVTHTGGTINVGTLAINPAAAGGGQRQTGHTSDLVAFAPFVLTSLGGTAPHPEYIVITSGPSTGSSAWIVSGLGATASLSKPMDATFGGDGAIPIGASYRIQRGSLLAVDGDLAVAFAAEPIFFNDFAFTSIGVTSPGTGITNFGRCSFDTFVLVPGVMNHCYIAQDLSFVASGGFLISAGVWLFTGGNTGDTVVEVTNDVYASSPFSFASIFCNGNGNGNLTIFAGNDFPSGMQIQDFPNATGAMMIGDTPPICTGQNGPGLIWGNGNAGRGIILAPNAGATVPAAAGSVPSVTGALGDYAFQAQNGGAVDATGRAWNEGGDTYAAAAATSWANFANLAVFGFQCHHLATNAHIVGV